MPIPFQNIAGSIEQYDPMSSIMKLRQLQALSQEAKSRQQEQTMREMQIKAFQQKQEQEQAVADAYNSNMGRVQTQAVSPEMTLGGIAGVGGGRQFQPLPREVQGPLEVNREGLYSSLAQSGQGQLIPGMQAQEAAAQQAEQEHMLKLREHLGTISKAELENTLTAYDVVGRGIAAINNAPPEMKPQVYQSVVGSLSRVQSPIVQRMIQQAPPQYDPSLDPQLKTWEQQAMSVKDHAAAVHAEKTLEETKNQNKATKEHWNQQDKTTRRGQDMVDKRSREQNDIKRDEKVEMRKTADNAQLTEFESDMDRLATAAKDLMDHPGLGGITGLRGRVFNIPGGQAAAAEAKLHNLKTQVAFGSLQKMRNASKTGGALGQVSDTEQKMLMNSVEPLDKEQSAEDLKKSLQGIIDYANGAKERGRAAFNSKFNGQQSKPKSDPLGIF